MNKKYLKNGTKNFHLVFNKLEKYYDKKDYRSAFNYIRFVLNEYNDVTYLRAILVISKSFKDNEILKNILFEVEKELSNKIGEVY